MAIHCPDFGRLSDWVGPWCIYPPAFHALADVVQRIDLNLHVEQSQDKPPELKSVLEKQPARNGQSVGVVKIAGTMMKSTSSVGGASTVQARRDIRNAAADPDISGILLALDTPGGTTSGTYDLAEEVRSARRHKPVWAHVDDLTASAGYWVASQAERIFANSPTAMIGSIGTYITIYDMSEAAAKEGIRVLHFATGPLKGAGAPGTKITDEQASSFQSLIDGSQQAFDAAVKRGRGLTDKQLSDVRTGGVFLAEEAQSRKLIDGIQSFSKTIAEMTRAISRPVQATSGLAATGGGLPMSQCVLPMLNVSDSIAIPSGVMVTLPAGFNPKNNVQQRDQS